MTKRLAFFIAMLICLNIARAQKKVSYVKLKNIQGSATIVFDLDSVSFHFSPATAITYLKGYKGHNFYLRPAIKALIKALKSSHGTSFVIRYSSAFTPDGSLDTISLKAKYAYAVDHILPLLLTKGEVMVYDTKKHSYVNRIHITEAEGGDYIGPTIHFNACYPDGKLFYSNIIRGTSVQDYEF